MKMRVCVGVAVIVLLLGACAPSEAAVQEAIEATAAAMPTATVEPTAEATATPEPTATPVPTATAEALPTATAEPTAVPLGEIDLGPLLIVEGDLPDNLDGEFVQYGEHFRFDREDVPSPDQLVSQQFYDLEDEGVGGGVAVYVYEDEATARQTYGAISSVMTGLGGQFWENRDDVGDRARLEQNSSNARAAAAPWWPRRCRPSPCARRSRPLHQPEETAMRPTRTCVSLRRRPIWTARTCLTGASASWNLIPTTSTATTTA